MTKLDPIPIQERCDRCRGLGGFSRGATALDCCESCAGSGVRTCLMCPVALMGVPCGEHVLAVVVHWDTPITRYGCLNGHRWDYHRTDRSWARVEDVAVAEAAAP